MIYLNAPPPALLALADEEGMLVVESARRGLAAGDEETELIALMRRDRSHPSILGWLGPSPAQGAFAALRKLDPTRFLLVRTPAGVKLYPPHADESQAQPPPPGLLPP